MYALALYDCRIPHEGFTYKTIKWSIQMHDLGFLSISFVDDFFTPGMVDTNLGKLETLQILSLVRISWKT